MNVYERLLSAKENGELIAIIYHGGSHPGKARMIYPIKVTESEVWGREPDAKQAKQFKLEKVEIAAENVVVHDFSGHEDLQEPATLKDAIYPYLADLESSKLAVNVSETSVSLHSCFKNGKPRKSSELIICYHEPSPYRFETNLKTGERYQVDNKITGKERPWFVGSTRGGWHFKNLGSAVARFIEEFRAMQE